MRYLVLVIFKGSILVQWPKRNTKYRFYTCFSKCPYFYLPLLLILFWLFILVYHFHLFSEITMAESNCKHRRRERYKQEDNKIFARMASYQAWYQRHKIRRMMLTIMLCYMVATFIALTDGKVEPSYHQHVHREKIQNHQKRRWRVENWSQKLELKSGNT